MALRISPPDLEKCGSFERYKQELKAWQLVTDVEKKKQGVAMALSLPEKGNTIGQVFDELEIASLNAEDGFDKLVIFLAEKLGKDDLSDCWEKFEDFEEFVRKDGQISDYVAKFDLKYNRIMKKGMILPPEVLAFKLLKRAKITNDERLLVLTGMDYSKRSTLFEQAKKSLTKFKGESCACAGMTQNTQPAVTLEPAFLAENEEALLAAG